MLRIAIIILALLTLAGTNAAADVVYLRNGRTYEGQVTRSDGKVIVLSGDKRLEFKAADVLHVGKSASPGSLASDGSPSATKPVSAPLLRGVNTQKLARPESFAFLVMRNIGRIKPGVDSYNLRRELDKWRAWSHDRRRRIPPIWAEREHFQRRRRTFISMLAKAEELHRQYRRYRMPRTRGPALRKRALAEREGLRKQLVEKLTETAQVWADPIIRRFLMGAAYLHDEQYAAAEAMFRNARKLSPRIAAYCQGHAMAMTGLDRHLDALEAYERALRLKPDSKAALRQLRDALQRVPGTETKRDAFIRAMELVSRYEPPSSTRDRRRRGLTWLLPGGEQTLRHVGLPMPKYDRIALKQAVGVPISPNVIIVDAAAVTDALEVYLAIDETTFIPGTIIRRRNQRSDDAPAPPLALVSFPDVVFTPPIVDLEAEITAGTEAQTFGLNLLEEMGSTVRTIPTKMVSMPSGQTTAVRPEAHLAPGEAASPVISDNRLLGFLAGRTDVTLDSGGEDIFLPVSRLAPLLSQARRRKTLRSRGRLDRATLPRRLRGSHFTIHATHGEKFDE